MTKRPEKQTKADEDGRRKAVPQEQDHLFEDPKLREGVCDLLNTVMSEPERSRVKCLNG